MCSKLLILIIFDGFIPVIRCVSSAINAFQEYGIWLLIFQALAIKLPFLSWLHLFEFKVFFHYLIRPVPFLRAAFYPFFFNKTHEKQLLMYPPLLFYPQKANEAILLAVVLNISKLQRSGATFFNGLWDQLYNLLYVHY